MQNVTLAVRESDLRAARIRAAAEATTVTAVLRSHLVEYARGAPPEQVAQSWQTRVAAAAGRYPSRLGQNYLDELRAEWPQ
ncbi:MAG: hypothetical protein LBJ08_02980 [Bifidobacteriaceae bacterium]|nr:hypothetical protein [Bifidobacteriaceae bacterium]